MLSEMTRMVETIDESRVLSTVTAGAAVDITTNLPADLQHIDSQDMMLQQVALVNLIAIVDSGDDVLSAEDAIVVNNRIDVMDPASRIQAVEVT